MVNSSRSRCGPCKVGERKSPEQERREYEADQAYRRDQRLRAELTETLLLALSKGPDVIAGVQRLAGHDLARLGLLHPEVRFVRSSGEPADRIVEVPVEVPSSEPFDPHELECTELLRIVKARLWEDMRVDQAERVKLITLCRDLLGRLGGITSR